MYVKRLRIPSHTRHQQVGRSAHVWGQEEQTFQDVQRIPLEANLAGKHCPLSLPGPSLLTYLLGKNPRDIFSHKIRDFCITAQKYGYRWAWVDTCCIDKTSSAELSEGINSMFRYYGFSQVWSNACNSVPTVLTVF